MTDTPMLDAWLTGQAHREAFQDLTPQQINDMDLGTYARLTGRSLKFTPEPVAEPPAPPQAPDSAFTQTVEAPQGIDVSQITMEQYAALRGQLGIGRTRQEGVGIMNQSGSQSWAEAAQRQPGRSGWMGRNTIESPRLVGRQERQGDGLDHRAAAQRLSNQSTMWQG